MTDEEKIVKFKNVLPKALEDACYRSRACKDSTLEHVVLLDGKRIEVHGKNLWSSRKRAENAVQRYLVEGKRGYFGTNDHIWRSRVVAAIYPYKETIPGNLNDIAMPIRKSWVDNHIRVMPLREYMVIEYKREKNE